MDDSGDTHEIKIAVYDKDPSNYSISIKSDGKEKYAKSHFIDHIGKKVFLEVQQFRLIYEGELKGYESLELMQNELTHILQEKCTLLEKIIYSDNPHTIESL